MFFFFLQFILLLKKVYVAQYYNNSFVHINMILFKVLTDKMFVFVFTVMGITGTSVYYIIFNKYKHY